MLNTQFLVENSQLRTVASGSSTLKQGDSGQAVKLLQAALLHAGISLPEATGEMSKPPHGRFDLETAQAIQQFQTKNSLQPSGIADAATLTKIDRMVGRPNDAKHTKQCCTGHMKNQARIEATRQAIVAANQNQQTTHHVGHALKLPGGLQLPTGLRRLTQTQQETAKLVYGNSLDMIRIFLTDSLGYDSNPFTTAIRIPKIGVVVVVLHVGTFWPKKCLLIHELAHAWQSQHHGNPFKFMWNSLQSQFQASGVPNASSYAYRPGKPFHEYAAEQIAQQVETGVTSVVRHVASVKMLMPDTSNIASLAVPRYEIIGAPDVVKPPRC